MVKTKKKLTLKSKKTTIVSKKIEKYIAVSKSVLKTRTPVYTSVKLGILGVVPPYSPILMFDSLKECKEFISLQYPYKGVVPHKILFSMEKTK